MLKNRLSKLVKGSTSKFKATSIERRMFVIEQVMNENNTKSYNPRKARNKSLKGIMFTNK